MTVGQVKAKYQKRWDEVARQYEGVGTLSDDNGSTAVRGSESEFPEFESDIAAPPTYKSQSDAEVDALTSLDRNQYVKETGELMDELELKSMLEEVYKTISTNGANKDLLVLTKQAKAGTSPVGGRAKMARGC